MRAKRPRWIERSSGVVAVVVVPIVPYISQENKLTQKYLFLVGQDRNPRNDLCVVYLQHKTKPPSIRLLQRWGGVIPCNRKV